MTELPFSITVVRSGGFAGMRREWTIQVTAPEDAQRWQPLIEACPWNDSDGDGVPDGFVYAFKVADLQAVVPERQLRGAWQHLADEVQLAAGH